MKSILDIAHITLLETIRETIINMGGPATKGTLMRRAINIAKELPEVEYESLDAWEDAVNDQTHPITRIEGVSIRDGTIFTLPQCPFASSISTYKELFQGMPEEYSQIVTEYNKPGRFTNELMVGYGSGVSPFCAIHQPFRSAAGKKIKVAGNDIHIIQLGCKGGDGKKSVSNELCEIAGVSRETVEEHLDNGMCVYMVKVLEQE
ncbi:hypothetical protein [Methanobacterium sp.]|uniref:hypothetical protein n=1 Tax=Methanobacterium sp. TaxID=2164 RepID=UPI003C76157B